MERFTRAERRSQRERLVRQRFIQLKPNRLTDDAPWRYVQARKQARTGAICSCHQCGNPRKYRGNSEIGLTMQELRSNAAWKEET